MTILRHRWAFAAGLAFAAGALAPLAPARAGGLANYTGFANAGDPSDTVGPNGAVHHVAFDKDVKALGGSLYYMVLDRGDGKGNDAWGTQIKDFDQSFQAGLDGALKPSPTLDKKARYLYLYQVINDRPNKAPAPVYDVTIRLVIDPALITSWGYFGPKAKDGKAAEGTGVAFEAEFADDKNVTHVMPISTDRFAPGGPDRPFTQNAPSHERAPYGLASVAVGGKTRQVDFEKGPLQFQGEAVTRVPATVQLLDYVDFSKAPEIHTQGRPVGYDISQGSRLTRGALPTRDIADAEARPAGAAYAAWENGQTGADFGPFGLGANGLVGGPASVLRPVIYANTDADGRIDSSHSPAIRAVFYESEGDTALKSGERSVLFGFTSNFPPVFEATGLRGNVLPAGAAMPAAANGGDALPAADRALTPFADQLPVPAAFEAATPPAAGAGAGTVGGTLGGETAGGFGGGALGGGAGGGFGGGALGGAGGGSGAGGGGSGTGQQAQQQQAQQTQQQQEQQQQQQQQQQEQGGNGQVVPEPASLASALLGVPFLFLFLRRKKSAAPAAAG